MDQLQEHSLEPSSIPPDGDPDPSSSKSSASGDKGRKIRKKTWVFQARVFSFRMLFYGFFTVLGLLILGICLLHTFVNDEKLRLFLIAELEHQTGGRFEIQRLQYHLLKGLKLEGLSFYPPQLGDTRGYAQGGGIEEEAFLKIKKIDIQYDLKRLISGRFYIQRFLLTEPEINLKKEQEISSLQGLLDYRAKAFPEGITEKLQDTTEESESSLPEFMLSPTFAFMPLEIQLNQMGVENLSVFFQEGKKDQPTKKEIELKGLSLNTYLRWHRNRSILALAVYSTDRNPLQVIINELSQDVVKSPQYNKKRLLSQSALLGMNLSLENFESLSYDLAMDIQELKTETEDFKNLGVNARIRLKSSDYYKKLKISEFTAQLADGLSYMMAGDFSVSSFNLEAIDLNLNQSLQVNLGGLKPFIQPFRKELEIGGLIDVEEIRLHGRLVPDQLKKFLDNPESRVSLPTLSASVSLGEVWANDKQQGIQLGPLGGGIHLGLSPAPGHKGAQLDLDVDSFLEKGLIQQKISKLGDLSAGFEHLRVKLLSRLLYPSLEAPLFKFNLDAEHIHAKGKRLSSFDVPLHVDVDAEGRSDLENMAVSAEFELPGLLESMANLNCSKRCQIMQAKTDFSLSSFQKLHALILPIGSSLGFADSLPTKMEGSLTAQLHTRASLPDPFVSTQDEILKKAQIDWKFLFELEKFATDLKLFATKLSGFDAKIQGSGTTKEQKIEISNRFDRLTLDVPMKKPENPTLPISIKDFSFSTGVFNEFNAPLDLNDLTMLLQQQMTTVRSKLSISEISGLPGILPKPVQDFQLALDLSQEKTSDIQLKDLSINVPSYGVALGLKSAIRLNEKHMPSRFMLNLDSTLAMPGEDLVTGGLKLSGGIVFNLGINADDMEIIFQNDAKPEDMVKRLVMNVEGFAKFDRFHLNLPNPQDQKGQALLVLDNMHGEVPLKQRVDVKAMLDMIHQWKMGLNLPKARQDSTIAAAVKDKEEDNVLNKTDPLNEAMQHYFEKHTDKVRKNANQAALVDYATVRAFFPKREPISIKRLDVANIEVSDIELDLELKQNWFSVNQFALNLLGGKIRGDLQFGFDPIPRFLKTSLQMTKLDTRKLLDRFPNLKAKTKSSLDILTSDPEIDGTMRFAYDIAASDMNGGLEITKIGKEQVEMLLYYIDPYEQNPSIADLRKALLLGEPSRVSVPIKTSRVGFEIEVRSPLTLGQPIPGLPRFRDIPINQIVDGVIAKVIDNQKSSMAPEQKPTEPQQSSKEYSKDNINPEQSGKKTTPG